MKNLPKDGRSINDIHVSLYEDIFQTSGREVNLASVLEMIKTGMTDDNLDLIPLIKNIRSTESKDERNALKSKLPAVTFAGTFEKARRRELLKANSGIISLDIDNVDDPISLKKSIIGIPFILACFLSPSNGLKVLIPIDSSDEDDYKAAFISLQFFFHEQFEINIDKHCSDISRLCYLSYDPEIHINVNCEIYSERKSRDNNQAKEPQEPINQEVWDNVEKLVVAIEKAGTDLTESYHNWVKIGFALTDTFGEQGRGFFHRISCFYPKYSASEANKQYDHCLKANREGITLRSLFYLAKAFGILQDSMQSKNANGPKAISIYELFDLLKDYPKIEMLWRGIPAGSFGFIFGPAKSGKTILCENLGMMLAAQQDELLESGLSSGQHNVLFISLEEFWQSRTGRNLKQIEALHDRLKLSRIDKYKVVDYEFPRNIVTDDDWLTLEKVIKESESDIIFIDSFTRLYAGEIETSRLAKAVAGRLRDMAYKLKITLIAIHHSTKLYKQPITMDALAGSRVLAQEADFMIGVSKGAFGQRYVKDVAYRYSPEEDDVIVFEINDDLLVESVEICSETSLFKKSDGRTDETNTNLVLDFFQEQKAAGSDTVPTGELISKFVDSVVMSRPTLFSQLKKLEKRKKIEKMQKGVYKLI
jgi:archaellum biogenesis ATPase FlaH